MPRVCHSYARFSTLEQAQGDSERRQVEAARAYCERQGFELSDLKLIDRGRSAYKPDRQRALGEFLRAAEDGRVKAGDILLIEAIDRLSRKSILQTQKLIIEIFDSGIDIAILTPMEKIYSAESYQIGEAIELAAFAYQANLYSTNLSHRIRASCEQARKRAYQGQIIAGAGRPSWLEVKSGKFMVKAEARPAIAYIFRRVIGGASTRSIVAELQSRFPPWSKRKKTSGTWNQCFVRNLLTDRRAIGEFQPYEPTRAVSRGPRSPVLRTSRGSGATNIFRHLAQ
jgi:DNA invertase Pin-like site-specific DNA recombinase